MEGKGGEEERGRKKLALVGGGSLTSQRRGLSVEEGVSGWCWLL